MNRRIAAWTIATVAVLGLTACSGAPAAEDDTSNNEAGDSATTEETETNTDQSVEDACGIVIPAFTEAGSAMNEVDPASGDPQASVDQFNTVVADLGATVDEVSNPEVKAATTEVYDHFVSLGEILTKVVVEEDLSAAEELTTVTTDMTESATALQELCS